MTRTEGIVARLRARLDALHVEIEDESALHRGHAGARGGAGHYRVLVVSQRFAGLDRVARQRAVYEALGDMIPGEIHALSSRTLTPEEWKGTAS
ncbi:MAG TPA: BolA family protein [Candidatus Binatia bacterium]|nr:BolA family protein [Candidatus Binatia bacterium]